MAAIRQEIPNHFTSELATCGRIDAEDEMDGGHSMMITKWKTFQDNSNNSNHNPIENLFLIGGERND